MSFLLFTRLPTADAAASARVADLEITQTASALPKLNDGQTVADDVHIPNGVSSGFIMTLSL